MRVDELNSGVTHVMKYIIFLTPHQLKCWSTERKFI